MPAKKKLFSTAQIALGSVLGYVEREREKGKGSLSCTKYFKKKIGKRKKELIYREYVNWLHKTKP